MGDRKAVFKAIDVPETFTGSYTDDDIERCKEIIEFLNSSEKSMSWIAVLARVDKGTTNKCLRGVYTSPAKNLLKKLSDAIKTQIGRNNIREIPFVKTTVSEIVWAACLRARTYKSFAMVPGFVGTGKTRSLKEYKASHENTVMIEADPGMSVTSLLDALVKALGCSMVKASANQDTKFNAVLDAVTGTDTLLIVDEAETLTPKALHYLRRIRDKAGIGIVLAGTESLSALIKPEHGQFDQIRSRVNFWPATVNGIKRDDAEAIINTAFCDLGELEESVVERLWQYSAGSMRLLVEDLIPAIRDYGLPKHEMSVKLIDQIANKVLNLNKPA